jgi:hypothetical protein
VLIAEKQFRRIIGYRDLAQLVIAIERRHLAVTVVTPDNPQPAEHGAPAAALATV